MAVARSRKVPGAARALTFLAAWWLASLSAGELRAEVAVTLYAGAATAADSDVELTRPPDTKLTFEGVSWDDRSFDTPIYWGVRVGYWLERSPRWGIALDFTHAKLHGELEENVRVVGTRDGQPTDGVEPLGDTFGDLEFSHGYNLLLVNGEYRWVPRPGHSGTNSRRFRPFVGVGLGVVLPHVETRIDGVITDEYQLGGPAAQVTGGVDIRITRLLSLLPAYKLNYSRVEVDLTDGSTLKLQPWTHQLLFGVTFSF